MVNSSTSPDWGNCEAICFASDLAHITATVGPEPDNHAHHALVLKAASSAALDPGAFAKRMSAMRLGDGLDPQTHVGPLISRAQQDNVATAVEGAIAGGATVVCGGKRAGDSDL